MNAPVSPAVERWFRRPKPASNGRMRLLCFPPAGSGAGFYRQWSNLVPASIEILSVQYPGREDRIREPFSDSLVALADDIASVAAMLADRPLALFGHSMGAAVAYEVATRLEAADTQIVHLAVSGRPPPHRQRRKTIHRCDDEGVLEEIERLGGTPRAVLEHRELRALLLPSIRADFRLIETYNRIIDRKIIAPVSAFIGEDDTEVSFREAEQWSDVTKNAFHLSSYPGGHFYLAEQPGPLIRDLSAKLAIAAWPCTP